MAITLTESAAKQIQHQLAKRGKGLGLRVGVKKVGCSGFAYTFDYADEVRAGDQVFELHAAKVVVAVPVAATSALDVIRREADEVVCVMTGEPFFAVGYWYDQFDQTPDEEVVEALRKAPVI